MPSNIESVFRTPTDYEQSLLERLLEAEFPGRDQLTPMIHNLLVRTVDESGGLELRSQVDGKSPVAKRVPVEAEAKDEDGVVIHILLHVVDGRPIELEFFKEDGTAIRRRPSPSVLELLKASAEIQRHQRKLARSSFGVQADVLGLF